MRGGSPSNSRPGQNNFAPVPKSDLEKLTAWGKSRRIKKVGHRRRGWPLFT